MAIYNVAGNIKDDFIEKNRLENLDLSWEEKELPQKIRTKHVHKLHPYMGKFIPQLVEIFLKKLFKPNDTILDPFGGSGTTLVETLVYGGNAIGVDISPFNCLMMKVKTGQYDVNKLEKEILDIYNKIEYFFDNDDQKKLFAGAEKEIAVSLSEEDLLTENEFINTWYTEKARKELLLYRNLIKDYVYKDVLKIILSRSARSARNIKHYELDHPKEPVKEPYYCRKHSRTCYPVSEAMKFLKRYSFDTIERIREFQKIRGNGSVEIINDDIRNFSLDKKVDGVITSPPYVGNIDYHEQHNYAYSLLNLPRNDELEIGPKFEGKSKAARKKYKEDMIKAFINVSKNVKDNGKIVVIANDKFDMYEEIFSSSNLKLNITLNRDVNRRTGIRGNGYSEYIFIAEK